MPNVIACHRLAYLNLKDTPTGQQSPRWKLILNDHTLRLSLQKDDVRTSGSLNLASQERGIRSFR